MHAGDGDSDADAEGSGPFESRIAGFESAAIRGEAPEIADYLPPDGDPIRLRVLVEIVHADLEFRLKRGEPARVESYLRRFEELGKDPEAVLGLIAAEFRFRRRSERGLPLAEYEARFPSLDRNRLIRYLMPTTRAESANRADQCHRAGKDVADLERLGLPPTGARLGPYRLLGVLGRGSAGVVYRARDDRDGREVALKVARPALLAEPGAIERFLREARSTAGLDHPCIRKVFEAGRHDGLCFLSGELIEGLDPSEWRLRESPDVRRVASLAADLARALQHTHDRGVIHRDLKPRNILVRADDRPVLLDFGLARRLHGERSLTAEGDVLGTPAFMSPEQARGESRRVDARGDIYSLGAVIYLLVTGRPPFLGPAKIVLQQVVHDTPTPPRGIDPALPEELERIILLAMRRERDDRYRSAREMADDLDAFGGRPASA